MLDIKYVRDNVDLIKKGAIDKRIKVDLDRLLTVDQQMRPLNQEIENLKAERNRISKAIPGASALDRESLKKQVGEIKASCDKLEKDYEILSKEFDELMLLVPQPARSDVPIGKDDSENVEVKRWGTIPKFDFELRDHSALGEGLDIIDVPRGVKLAGSRSYVLKGLGSQLEHAVLRYTFEKLVRKGYVPMSIPVLVKEQAMLGTGYFPTGRDQAYWIEKDQLALVGTSEVSLASYHSGEILRKSDLPLRYVAQSSCFRREAGTYGKDTQGLYRVHQFQKIEQVIIANDNRDETDKLHEELLTNAEEILQDLQLPYRVVYVCTGDLGQGQVRKHDIETWMPSRQAYSETHSCSTFYDFQARRLKIRFKEDQGQAAGSSVVCYTLNNTAVATPRILIPLLEVYQTSRGTIKIPDVLVPYMNGIQEITKP